MYYGAGQLRLEVCSKKVAAGAHCAATGNEAAPSENACGMGGIVDSVWGPSLHVPKQGTRGKGSYIGAATEGAIRWGSQQA